MNIYIQGAATTKFGELWARSPRSLVKEAADEALQESGAHKSQIEALYVGNMLSGILGGQEQLGAMFCEELGLGHIAAVKVEGACASGGLAVHQAVNALLSGMYETVMVVGVEKMTDHAPNEVTRALTAASSDSERWAGATFPGLYAIMARAHMEAYETTEEQLAAVAVKNHYHASLNGKAHFTNTITVEQVLKSSKIADPLKLLDCSPISDGASVLILSSKLKEQSSKGVEILASCVATDSIGLAGRESLTSLKATKTASKKAYDMAGVGPKDVHVAEVHDCFTIAEIMAMEDLGFFNVGEAAKNIEQGVTKLGGKGPIVNTSGGLKASGHPVGATGVKQLVEITKQLRGMGEKKQVEGARIGLTHNVGGTGGTAVVHILKQVY